MGQRTLGIFLMTMAMGAAIQAESASGVAVFPPGVTSVQALMTAGQDLLRRIGYQEIRGSLEEERIEASATYYDTTSAGGSGGISESTLSWTLTFRTETDGRIVMTLDHQAEGARSAEDLPQFARNLAIGAGASPAKVLLTFKGETKPLTQWRQRASTGM